MKITVKENFNPQKRLTGEAFFENISLGVIISCNIKGNNNQVRYLVRSGGGGFIVFREGLYLESCTKPWELYENFALVPEGCSITVTLTAT